MLIKERYQAQNCCTQVSGYTHHVYSFMEYTFTTNFHIWARGPQGPRALTLPLYTFTTNFHIWARGPQGPQAQTLPPGYFQHFNISNFQLFNISTFSTFQHSTFQLFQLFNISTLKSPNLSGIQLAAPLPRTGG